MPYDNWTYNTAVNGVLLSSSVIMQNAANANGNGVVLPTTGYGIAVLSVAFSTSPAWSGTVNFEAQGPDGNWYPINGRLRGSSNAPSTTIAGGTGLYSLNVRGVQAIRTRVSGYSAGSVTITGQTQALPSSDADEVANVSLTGSKEIFTAANITVAAGAIVYQSLIDIRAYRSIDINATAEAAPASGTTIDCKIQLYDVAGNAYSTSTLDQITNSSATNLNPARKDTLASFIKPYFKNNDTVSHTINHCVINGWIN